MVDIVLEPQLDITKTDILYSQLEEAIKSGEQISLHGQDVEKVDAAAMQLILAAKKQVDKQDIAFVWANPSAAIIESAKTLGISAELDLK